MGGWENGAPMPELSRARRVERASQPERGPHPPFPSPADPAIGHPVGLFGGPCPMEKSQCVEKRLHEPT